MARVLTMIETACPNALSKKVSTDEVLINFDALTPRCFHEVNAFVLACFLNLSGNRKKKRKSDGAGAGSGSGAAGVAGEGGGSGGGDGDEAGVETKGNDGEDAEF